MTVYLELIDNIYLSHVGDNPPELFKNNRFSCATVGCIAGFATAIACDYKNVVNANNIDHMRGEGFVAIASNYLNVPIDFGKKTFLSLSGSVWSFILEKINSGQLKDDDILSRLDWMSINESYEEEPDDEGMPSEYIDYKRSSVDIDTIDYDVAIKVLEMIYNDEIMFDYLYEPYFPAN